MEESYFAPAPEHQPEENEFSLHSKLQEEANYHLFGSRMDKARPQPGPALTAAREEERRRRVSHDPFMSERKGFMAPGAAAGPDTAGHPLGPYWNGSCHPAGFGARPLEPGITGTRVWNEPIPSYLYPLKLPVFENIMSTPTLPFNSQLSRGMWALPSLSPAYLPAFLSFILSSPPSFLLSFPSFFLSSLLPNPVAISSLVKSNMMGAKTSRMPRTPLQVTWPGHIGHLQVLWLVARSGGWTYGRPLTTFLNLGDSINSLRGKQKHRRIFLT